MKRHLEHFHYQISGNPQGHKLVFLHGFLGSALNWSRVAQAFTADFHVLLYDQRGHGRSFQPPRGSYRTADYAEDLAKILGDLGWDQVALVGHSMGARNALHFAAHFAHRVSVLVLEDIGPHSPLESSLKVERLLKLVPAPFSSREAARDFFTNVYPNLVSAIHPNPAVISKFLLSNIEPKSDGTFDWRFAKDSVLEGLFESRKHDAWEEFSRLTMPTLIIRGQHSEDLPREQFEHMLKVQPLAQGVEIAGAGHWVHSDQTETFVGALRAFFHQTLGSNL